MPRTSASTYKKDYTKPQLRERLKEEIKQGSKGGKPNQWSARKAQLLKKSYEAHGGSYKHSGQKTKAQKSLTQWTQEDWQTSDQKTAIRDGKTTRYLPKKVWDKLSPTQKKQTDKLKVQGSRRGKQKISNPKTVRTILSKTRQRKTSH